jgi:hypothetical protein
VKFIYQDDADNGFARIFNNGLSSQGCPQPNAHIACSSFIGGMANGTTRLDYRYLLRSTKDITSAPVTMSFGMKQNDNGAQEHTITALRFLNSRSVRCREDGPTYGVVNADWDNAAIYNNDPNPANDAEGDGNQWISDTAISARIGIVGQSGNYRDVPNSPYDTTKISGGWKDDLWRIPIGPGGSPGLDWSGATDQTHGYMMVRDWNEQNLLYIGEAEFSSGNLPDCSGNLRIYKFNDANQNGVRDGSEGGLGSISFRITGPNGYDTTQSTDGSGYITLNGLANGIYQVAENVPAGWVSTTGNTKTVTVGGSTQTAVFGDKQQVICGGAWAGITQESAQATGKTPADFPYCQMFYNGYGANQDTLRFTGLTNADGRPYVASKIYVDGVERLSTRYHAGLNDAPTFTMGGLAPGNHSFSTCATGSNYSQDQVPLWLYRKTTNPNINDYVMTTVRDDAFWATPGRDYALSGSIGYIFDSAYSGTSPLQEYSHPGSFDHTYGFGDPDGAGTYWTFSRTVGHVFTSASGADRVKISATYMDSGADAWMISVAPPPASPNTANMGSATDAGDPGDGWSCQSYTFRINAPSVATPSASPGMSNGGQVNYACKLFPPLQATVSDPDSAVMPQVGLVRFHVRGSGASTFDRWTNLSRPIPSGGTVTSDDVIIDGVSLTDWLANPANVAGGTTVSWSVQSLDPSGAADLSNPDWFASQTIPGNSMALYHDIGGVLLQPLPGTGWKWGPESGAWSFYKRTAANITSTKQYYDLTTNAPITGTRNISDGETVKARLTITNNGQTPTQYYTVRDYLGYIRDFEQPRNFVLESAGNAPISPNITPVKTAAGDTAIANPNDINTAWDGSWKIDFGSNNGANGLPNGELAPGGSVTISYIVRADRNMTDRIKAAQGGAYNESNASNPNNSFNSSTNDIVISTQASQTKADFTQNYCSNAITSYNSGNVAQNVVTPTFKGVRGDINSNSSIYASGNKANATFVVTATGSIAQAFGGGSPYNGAGNTTATNCSVNGGVQTTGGINWRSDLTKNMLQLMAGSVNNSTNGFNANLFNPGAGNPNRGVLSPGGGSNVWVHTGDLNISVDPQFTGVGTIIVKGNLNIRSNMNYKAGAAGLSSVGFVVFGNITVDKSVTHLVGSYYSSDVLINAVGNTNCPNVTNSQGLISTGRSNQQLVVEGLMVARQFNLERYYTNTSPAAAATPAELVYYDGRVIAATPPGFSTFSSSAQWTELLP